MNILDIGILAMLTINLFIGLYNGFMVTVFKIIAYFGSWILSFALYPILSNYLIAKTGLLETIMHYTDASSRIADFSQRNLNVSGLSEGQITTLVEQSKIPQPFDKAILANATSGSLFDLQTIGEYFDYTVAKVVISILSFFIIFFLLRLIFAVVIGVVKTIRNIPILKQLDSLAGAGLGLVRGALILYIIFSILPLILTIAPMDFVWDFVSSSKLAPFFYKTNVLIKFIR